MNTVTKMGLWGWTLSLNSVLFLSSYDFFLIALSFLVNFRIYVTIGYLLLRFLYLVAMLVVFVFKKMFSCVLHTANTLTCFERSFFFIQKILEVSKMCFRMDFLNTTKIIFLHFWILQHVCKTPKGIGQYSKKYKKILFWGGEFIYYSPLMFG
jgi:hypothetical protein